MRKLRTRITGMLLVPVLRLINQGIGDWWGEAQHDGIPEAWDEEVENEY